MLREIESSHPFRMMAREGLSSYLPLLNGEKLQPENNNPEISLNNLVRILNENHRVTWVEIVETGRVYVAFHTGHAYLATGFAIIDEHSPMTKCFAEFLDTAIPGGSVEAWLMMLVTALGRQHRGGIMLVPGFGG